MRLLVVSWGPPPGRLDPQVAGLAAALAGAGVDVHVVAAGDGGPTRTVRHDGVPVTLVGEAPPVIPDDGDHEVERALAFGARAYAAALPIVRERPVDVVHAVGWRTAYAATNVRSSHGVPVTAALEPCPPTPVARGRGRLAAGIERHLADEARRVVTTSTQGRRALARRYGIPTRRIAVVPTGVHVAVDGRPGTAPTTGSAPAAVAVVAPADGPVGAAGPALARALRQQDVPVVADADRAAVVVVTDPAAGDRAVAVMAAGRALVVPHDGPLRDLVHARRSGLRIDPLDVAGTVAVVAALARDPRRVARLGRAGRARARERHAWPRVAALHLEVLRHAVAAEAALRAAGRPVADDAVVSMVGRGHGRKDARG